MMKKIFTLIFAVCIALSVSAQTGTSPNVAAKPAISAVATSATAMPPVAVAPTPDELLLVLKETEFNFGKIPQGKPVTHIFFVDNKSKDSLKIVNVQASCGCTTP